MDFGKYRLLEKIGQGGMAEVFYAHIVGSEGFTKEVALKRVLPHLCEDPDFVKSFVDEARLGGLLNHHHIVQTLDFGHENGSFYLAMEYVHGLTLREILNFHNRKKIHVPPPIVLELVLQLCDGLRYAHRAEDEAGNPLQMVHRDLKPTNILVSSHGVMKIADFGIARAETNVRRTQLDGVLKGTAQYMSPEQAMGDLRIDRRSDIFSIGSITFELITGRAIFYDPGSSIRTLRNVQDAKVDEKLDAMVARFPYTKNLRPILATMLARNPVDRPSEINEVMPALRRAHAAISRMTDTQAWIQHILAELGRPIRGRRSTSRLNVPVSPPTEKDQQAERAAQAAVHGHSSRKPSAGGPPHIPPGLAARESLDLEPEEPTPVDLTVEDLEEGTEAGQPRTDIQLGGAASRGAEASVSNPPTHVQTEVSDARATAGRTRHQPESTLYAGTSGGGVATRVAQPGEFGIDGESLTQQDLEGERWDERDPPISRADVMPSRPASSPGMAAFHEGAPTTSAGTERSARTEAPARDPRGTRQIPQSQSSSVRDRSFIPRAELEAAEEAPFDRTEQNIRALDSRSQEVHPFDRTQETDVVEPTQMSPEVQPTNAGAGAPGPPGEAQTSSRGHSSWTETAGIGLTSWRPISGTEGWQETDTGGHATQQPETSPGEQGWSHLDQASFDVESASQPSGGPAWTQASGTQATSSATSRAHQTSATHQQGRSREQQGRHPQGIQPDRPQHPEPSSWKEQGSQPDWNAQRSHPGWNEQNPPSQWQDQSTQSGHQEQNPPSQWQDQGTQSGHQDQGTESGWQEQGTQSGYQDQGTESGWQEQGTQSGYQEQGTESGWQEQEPAPEAWNDGSPQEAVSSEADSGGDERKHREETSSKGAPPTKKRGRLGLYSLGFVALLVLGALGAYVKLGLAPGLSAHQVRFTVDTVPGGARVEFDASGLEPGLTPLERQGLISGDCLRLKITRDGYRPVDTCLSFDANGLLAPLTLQPADDATNVVIYYPSSIPDLRITIGDWPVDLRRAVARPNAQSSVRSYVSSARHTLRVASSQCGEITKEFDFTVQNAYKFLKVVRTGDTPCVLTFEHDVL